MKDYKNHKVTEPSDIREMVMASIVFISTMILLAALLAVWSIR